MGELRTLSGEQEWLIQRLISEKMPDQLKLSFALWTRNAVKELIKRRCGVEMLLRAVGEYLKRWGFTPQKPLKRAYEQKHERVEAWLEDDYPAIVQRAKEEGTETLGVVITPFLAAARSRVSQIPPAKPVA